MGNPPGEYEAALLISVAFYYPPTDGVLAPVSGAAFVPVNSPTGVTFLDGFETGAGCTSPTQCSNSALDNDAFFPAETDTDCGGACAACACDADPCGPGTCSEAGVLPL